MQSPPGKWASGNHLWFIDIVAPVGNILPRIKRDLHQNYFADHNKAYAIRRKADGAIRRVQVWKTLWLPDQPALSALEPISKLMMIEPIRE